MFYIYKLSLFESGLALFRKKIRNYSNNKNLNYFNLQLQFPSRDMLLDVGTSDIQTRIGFQIFPEEESIQRLGIPYVLDKPLYWSLPKDKLGDKVSY